MAYDVAVIGGGLAGSSIARRLAPSHRVLLLEAERYPVHKMCGEFLSPEAAGLFDSLGVTAAIRARGAVSIRRVAITAAGGSVWREALPGEGTGISRWALDPILFDAAADAGADCLQGARVRSVEGDAARGFVVRYTVGDQEFEAEARLVVGAYGKRSSLDRRLGREGFARETNYVAFKMHYTGDDLGDVVELHAFDGGYCGMSHVEDGRVNACLIATAGALRESGGTFEGMCRGVLRTNPALRRRLDRLEPAMERPVAIGRVTLQTRSLFGGDVMMVGDTAAMIAPLCGDGMSMALRASEIAAPLVSAVLGGEISFGEMRARYERRWRAAFGRRLWLGRWLQAALFRPGLASAGLGMLAMVPSVGRLLVLATRDAPSRRPAVPSFDELRVKSDY